MGLKLQEKMWAVVCWNGKKEGNICGAFVSKKEAQEWEKETELDKCVARHSVEKCIVTIQIEQKQIQ